MLSLQNKLDQISHDRDVLHLLRDLARAGVREGDTVHHARDGIQGRIVVARQDHPPRVMVSLDDGSLAAFDADLWRLA
jgi:hypothetical protein